MAPQIENRENDRTATKISERTGERENEALLKAIEEWDRRQLKEGPPRDERERVARARYFLENVVWPNLPPSARRPWSKEEEEEFLGYGGYGPEGT